MSDIDLPYASGSSTSARAAKKHHVRLNAMHYVVYRMIKEAGPNGLTIDEACIKLGKPQQTVGPRFSFLDESGYIGKNGLERKTRLGNDSVAYVVTDKDATVIQLMNKESQRSFLHRIRQATQEMDPVEFAAYAKDEISTRMRILDLRKRQPVNS